MNLESFAHCSAVGKAMATIGTHVAARKKRGPELFCTALGVLLQEFVTVIAARSFRITSGDLKKLAYRFCRPDLVNDS